MNESRYYPQLDIVRFIAFAMVFLHHGIKLSGASPEWLVAFTHAGTFGVTVFFTLSSYLITSLLLPEHERRGRIDVRAFWIRRALRIWPLYFLMLFIAATLMPHRLTTPHLGWFMCFLGNWSCVAYGYPPSVAAPLWSVSVEEQFYLFWPLLLLTFGVKRLRSMALILICVGMGSRVALAAIHAGTLAFWCGTFCQLDSIACGAILATVWQPKPQRFTSRFVLVAVAGFAFLVESVIAGDSGWQSVLGYLGVSLASVALIIAVGSSQTMSPIARIVAYLGKISYGLYVFHRLTINLAYRLPMPDAAQLVVAFVLTIIIAAANYHLFEIRFINLKRKFTP